MPSAVHPRAMGTPRADSSKGTSAFVAQEATLNIDSGRTLGQVDAALEQNAVKATSPNKAKALINMRSSGSALNTVKTTLPHVGRTPS